MTNESLCLGVLANSTSFCLPSDVATQKLAFLARSGAGKSYSASKLAELMHAAGFQFVVLDPVGIWYGLRLGADGESAGLNIPVFGGEFGDIPLEPTAGALVADLVVERGISVVLDVSSFRKAGRKQFVTEFAEELFHRKKTARSPLHLFLEEAQVFIPQRTMSGEERMLGAFEDIGKIGRNYGIGLSLISQRPQSVNKDVLNQTECLFVLQLNAAQERKAVRDWIDTQGIDAGAAVDELPNLSIGEAYVWSPQWLKFFGKVRINTKQTYNASATPTFDTPAVAPRPLEDTDLEALRVAMQTVVEEAATHDPKALRARITDLERQLKERNQQPVASPVTIDLTAIQRLEDLARSLDTTLQQANRLLQGFQPAMREMSQSAKALAAPPKPRPAPRTAPKSVRISGKLTDSQQRILNALAEFAALGLSHVERANVAAWAGQSPRSGSFNANVTKLKDRDCIDYPAPGYLSLTSSGTAQARPRKAPRSLADLHAAWLARVSPTQASMLRGMLRIYPQAIARSVLADATGQSRTSGSFNANVTALKSLGIVTYPKPGYVAAAPLLFPRGLS